MKTTNWVAAMHKFLAISLHVMRHLSNSSPCACHGYKVGHHPLLAAASVHPAKPEQGLCILFVPHQSCQAVGYLVHPLWWCSRNLHLSQSWSMHSNDCACLVDVVPMYIYLCNPALFSRQLNMILNICTTEGLIQCASSNGKAEHAFDCSYHIALLARNDN